MLIFDYGVGNLYSLKTAFERLGTRVKIESSLSSGESAEAIVLPGVGSFDAAVRRLEGSRENLLDLVGKGRPLLGICLGMQLFFERSEEGAGKGLSLMQGEVVRLPSTVKVPQMGWNTLSATRNESLLDGAPNGTWVYFVHSYYPKTLRNYVLSTTEYGVTFPSSVRKGAVFGTQFHPEKSSKAGRRMLENFVRFCRR